MNVKSDELAMQVFWGMCQQMKGWSKKDKLSAINTLKNLAIGGCKGLELDLGKSIGENHEML